MNFEVIATKPFERKLKRLVRKYNTLINDLAPVIDSLIQNPTLGTPIGKGCYKYAFRLPAKEKEKVEVPV